jgi:hypothetical protein
MNSYSLNGLVKVATILCSQSTRRPCSALLGFKAQALFLVVLSWGVISRLELAAGLLSGRVRSLLLRLSTLGGTVSILCALLLTRKCFEPFGYVRAARLHCLDTLCTACQGRKKQHRTAVAVIYCFKRIRGCRRVYPSRLAVAELNRRWLKELKERVRKS